MSAWTQWLTGLAGDGLGGVLVVLLPLGLLVFLGACAAFAWAVRSNQFDNLEVEARRILFDQGPTHAGAGSDARTPDEATQGHAPGPDPSTSPSTNQSTNQAADPARTGAHA